MTSLCNPTFIVIDGQDGAGKTSLIDHLVDKLNRFSLRPVRKMRALGQGPIGLSCRTRHLESQTAEGFESLMMPMSIIEAYNDFVMPAIEDGCHVVMDRWVASYFAYQVTARKDKIAQSIYNTLFVENNVLPFWPDLYVLCNVDIDVAQSRLNQRQDETNYLDQESRVFKEAVRDGFETFKLENDNRTVRLDCNQDFETVSRSLDLLVSQLEG
jgi:dTMP kinase